MIRIMKVLNNNGILGLTREDKSEVIVLGKGVGFGVKVSEYIAVPPNAKVYALETEEERGASLKNAAEVDPLFLEIANEILIEAEKEFGTVDGRILIPLADHIAYAIKRMEEGMVITNPLNEDIRALFQREYAVALKGADIIREAAGIEINTDETGYITLHIHSALGDEKVADSMEIARALHECIADIEQALKVKIDTGSLSYNRLMSHIKYMIVRAKNNEQIHLDMNEYIKSQFPGAYEIAAGTCAYLADKLHLVFEDVETGYLAMHVERVFKDEEACKSCPG